MAHMATASAAHAPTLLRVLAHDLRWAIVRLLAQGDMRVREVVAATGEAPNLITYHLAQLRAAGVVWVRRSTADGRDSYYALDLDAVGAGMRDVAGDIHPGLSSAAADGDSSRPGVAPSRVLFICTGNSSRSPMAEGWLRHLGESGVVAASAGTVPTPLHPLAVAAMAEHGVDISGHQVTHVDVFAGQSFDRVITLCDRAREACPDPPDARAVAHWSVPNPAEAHPADLHAFQATARELHTRVRYLLPLLGRPLSGFSSARSGGRAGAGSSGGSGGGDPRAPAPR
jgi:ArsR family transcriptional regulator, arsenate/arsenite/antimonite-responsive transcriptional repressor / arsenate reductase (thioredoxin)